MKSGVNIKLEKGSALERCYSRIADTLQFILHGKDRIRSLEEQNEHLIRQRDECLKEIGDLRDLLEKTEFKVGNDTYFDMHLAAIHKYIHENKVDDLAKLLDKMFEADPEKYRDRIVRRDNKDIIFDADVLLVHPRNTDEIARAEFVADKHSQLPIVSYKVPEVTNVLGKYVVIKKVIGPSLHEFYTSLSQSRIESVTKEQIVRMLVQRQLLSTVQIRNLKHLDVVSVRTDHVANIEDVFKFSDVKLSRDEREFLKSRFSVLDRIAKYRFRDANSSNYKLTNEAASVLMMAVEGKERLSDLQLADVIDNGLYAFDFEKLSRLTFQSDDVIQVLEWPVPRFSSGQIMSIEMEALKHMKRHGENIGEYFNDRNISSVYRHLRMWFHHASKPESHPDPIGRYKAHHLSMASESASKIMGLDSLVKKIGV
jgi:hypothetical protein